MTIDRMASIQELTAKLNQALKIQAQIESLQHQLNAIVGGVAPQKKLGRPAGKQKRTMSPATIAKMRVAQQKRWAHVKTAPAKKAKSPKTSVKAAPVKAAPKKKGGMSPE